MGFKAVILGCGSSGGVPRVGKDGWGACDPTNARNRRRRCSLLIQSIRNGAATTILVDTSPDLREQLLSARIDAIDAIFYTHAHADHTHGIDDVRPLVLMNKGARIDAYMDEATSCGVRGKFGYIFETPDGSLYPPLLIEKRLISGQKIIISGPGGAIEIAARSLPHGDSKALSFRFSGPGATDGGLAYTPDFNQIPDKFLSSFYALDVWIIDALRYARHPSHACIAESLDWIAQLKPRRAILTNLHTDVDYATLKAQLPSGIEPAYDGLSFEF